MANFCLPKEFTTPFLRALKDGTLDPQKLSQMESGARRAEFAKVVGEHAQEVNALFESKLLLKNQQTGIINWAKSVGGLKPEAMKDLLSKVEKMDRLLNPSEEKAFLSDLAEKKLGARVTPEEAKTIVSLAREAHLAKDVMAKAPRRTDFASQTKEEAAYGDAKMKFSNYVSNLKNEASAKTLREKGVGGVASDIAGASKGLKAAFDNSALGHQGWKTLFTHPTQWFSEAPKSFINLARQFGGANVMDEIHSRIVSDPDYDLAVKADLSVGAKLEEQYPTHIVESWPVIGRLYKSSETAYVGFVQSMRMRVFKQYLDIARDSGIDVSDKAWLQDVGKMVNSLTGRGYLGKGELVADKVNNIFFSPRLIKSNIDFLTAHQFQRGVTPFVRKQAAINLVKVIAGSAGILTIAHTINPKSVETDPRSADFGKIRIGDTRFDMTGGMGSLLTLAARLAFHSSKSSTTGKVTALDSGKFGSQTSMGVIGNFTQNKFSPIMSTLIALQQKHDFSGNPTNLTTPKGALNVARNLAEPLPLTNAIELYQNPNSANILVGTLADALGIVTNTYSAKKPK